MSSALSRLGAAEVKLPTMHPGQVAAWKLPARFKVVRCPRRFGKTDFGKIIACDLAIKRWPVGWFAPDYKRLAEAYAEIHATLDPVISSSSKVDGVIRLALGPKDGRPGGRIDFWTMNDANAGRSRKYKKVILDEAAFVASIGDLHPIEIWRRSIAPTLLDYAGSATVMSNTNGISDDNLLWQLCNQPEHGFVEYHSKSWLDNPHIPARLTGETDAAWQARRMEEDAKLRAGNHPLVYQQEYAAEFVDWSGVAFFSKDKLLVDGQPVPWPARCDVVYAIVDTATKTGQEHDGTAVVYFAKINYGLGYKLVILDWDIVQIQGNFLEEWIPQNVFARLEELAATCRARAIAGTYIEDKSSGMVLLQHAAAKGWPAEGIDSKLTSVGKSERAISVSGYVHRGEVKMSQHAMEKTVAYKGSTRNHLEKQVYGFRIGAKDKDDDLLDGFAYGIALGLGDSEAI